MHPTDAPVTVVQELELGAHTLFLMSDQSISIADFSGEHYYADNAISLTAEETYRLCVALQTMFQTSVH
jgi:hypothetical protein